MYTEIIKYPNYQITDEGIIYNKSGIALKYHYRKKEGHPRVTLYNNDGSKQFSVHRLVAIHFLPNPKNKTQVHHKDNNKNNPKLNNLEWVSNAENIQRAYDDGLISIEKKKVSSKKFGDNPGSVPVEIIHKQSGIKSTFDSIRRLQLFLKIKYTVSIHQAIREPHRTVKGYYIRKI
jgi:hypothetical protein